MIKKLLAVFTTALSIIAFYDVVVIPINGIAKFIISAVLLFLSGMCLLKLLNFTGEKGIIILATERGKDSLDALAKWNPAVWKSLADFGMVMGFGASSVLLFKKIPKRNLEVSLLILMLSTLFMLPYILPTARGIIQLPIKVYSVPLTTSPQSMFIETILYYSVFFCIALGGFSLAGVISFIAYGLLVLWGIFTKLLSLVGSPIGNAAGLSKISPGAAPIIPGINLPFFEGILALGVLLFVHEVSHGVLARVEKIRVKNSGLVLFGFIPIGAFVEPDEEQLQKSNPEKQKNVLVAGSSSNFLFSILFFILFMTYNNIILSNNPPPTSYFKEQVIVYDVAPNSPAYGVLKSGMVIKEWNGVEINALGDLSIAANSTKWNDTVSITTDAGSFLLKAAKNGKVGVAPLTVINGSIAGWMGDLSSQPGRWWVLFLYNFLGLTFVLNFLVGSVNLLPIPPFDGYRVLSLVVKDERIMKALAILMIVFFFLNFVPWVWYSG
jgi:membrane-associated protease RseP (regulator of RpoE activity)